MGDALACLMEIRFKAEDFAITTQEVLWVKVTVRYA
jgi:hypothetical protein